MCRSATRSYSRIRQRGISRKDGNGMSPLTTVDLKPLDRPSRILKTIRYVQCSPIPAQPYSLHEILLSFTRHVYCRITVNVVLYNLVKNCWTLHSIWKRTI